MPIRFEGRDLDEYAKPVVASELRVGEIYFAVQYVDHGMMVPGMEPLVFLGTALEAGEVDRYYFQDAVSYRNGVRFGAESHAKGMFYGQHRSELNYIFEYERALERLMVCSLRRKGTR